jgi:hypothetical protein
LKFLTMPVNSGAMAIIITACTQATAVPIKGTSPPGARRSA